MRPENAADMRARARDAWHSEWISKSGLKARLWTDKAIAEFLGKPEKAGPIMAGGGRTCRRRILELDGKAP